jgi:hypothetical protein
VFEPFYKHGLPEYLNPLDSIMGKEEALLEASSTTVHATCMWIRDNVNLRTTYSTFVNFLSTGIPAHEAPTVFSSSPLKPFVLTKLERPDKFRGCCLSLMFILSVTQRRSLAKVAGVSERDTEIWLSLLSIGFFAHTTAILAKAKRGRASEEERSKLGFALVTLLFASEVRNTFVLQAAQRHLEELNEVGGEGVGQSLQAITFIMIKYVLESPDQRKNLQRWARYWLRKLYGDGLYPSFELWIVALTVLCNMDLDPALQLAARNELREDRIEFEIDRDAFNDDDVEVEDLEVDDLEADDAEVDDAEDDDAEDDDDVEADDSEADDAEDDDDMEVDDLEVDDVGGITLYWTGPISRINYLLTLCGESLWGTGAKNQELEGKLKILACEDIPDSFPSRPTLSLSDKMITTAILTKCLEDANLSYPQLLKMMKRRMMGRLGDKHASFLDLFFFRCLVMGWIEM